MKVALGAVVRRSTVRRLVWGRQRLRSTVVRPLCRRRLVGVLAWVVVGLVWVLVGVWVGA